MANDNWEASRVDDNHVRYVSPDGTQSYLYELSPLGGETLVEIADHNPDGTTDAYHPGSIIDDFFWGGRGEHK